MTFSSSFTKFFIICFGVESTAALDNLRLVEAEVEVGVGVEVDLRLVEVEVGIGVVDAIFFCWLLNIKRK